jgi:magnesium chelatase family protein
LVASGELPAEIVDGTAFLGELGLDGTVRRVPGVIPLVAATGSSGNSRVVVPVECAGEASLLDNCEVLGAKTLAQLVSSLKGIARWPVMEKARSDADTRRGLDLADIRGQIVARRALEIAAAGGHHILFVGSPGSGKTMLATRLPGILPDLTRSEALEVSLIHSAAGLALPDGGFPLRPPFRAPHHAATEVSIVGGGTSSMRPGEISLSHCGVLFLDELGEFPASVLDLLRQPLEEGQIRLARASGTVTFPSRFQLVAAMNPCPCGHGIRPGMCRCTESQRARYTRRLSGPLMDRFDLAIPISRPNPDDLMCNVRGESSEAVAGRVAEARRVAGSRGVRSNAELPADVLNDDARLTPDAASLLENRLRSGAISARGFHRIHRVARTIADLEGVPTVSKLHVAEALELRSARDALIPA